LWGDASEVEQMLKAIPGSRITGPALWAAARARIAQWDWIAASAERVRKAQLATLREHCQRAAATEFGRAHGLSEVSDDADFRRRVPVRAYAGFEPYLERMRRGERDVLYPGLIPYYGQSSGTSNTAAKNKFLPISPEQIRWQQRAGFDVTARYLALTRDTELTGGYWLGLLPPAVVKREGEIGVGSNPGIMQLHVPRLTRPMMLPKPQERDIEDYSKKLDAVAAAYLDYDVRALAGTTCWFPLFFDRLLAAARARGRQVRTVSDIWPNVRVLFGGGVAAEPYRPIIAARLGAPAVLMDNYNATEGGIFAITWSLSDDSLLVVPDRGVYFEFVPKGREGDPDAPRVPLWRVERDVDYSVVLTTSSGLFAYEIGDYVRFSSVSARRPRFAGRRSGVLSLTQELMTQLEIERAVGAAAAATASAPLEFAAGPEMGIEGTAKGRYVVFVEFERPPIETGAFAEALDRSLCDQNRVYREHRKGEVAILAPQVVPLRSGATRRFMEMLGQTSVQQKFPRIIDSERSRLLRSLAAEQGTGGSP
jgi:hypothetical protein